MKYKHVLFLYPYIESSATSVMKLFPPTGLEYVVASAQGFADTITLLDLRYEEELCDTEKLLDFISRGVDLVCVSIGWDRQFKEVCELLNRLPVHIPLVVGGHKATEMTEELFHLCPNIAIIVRGEGEATIREILQGVSLEKILGISYRDGDTLVHNAFRPLEPIETIPVPRRQARRYDYRLTVNGVNVMDLTFDTVLSARGCPYDCKFCTFSLNPLGQRRKYSARSVSSVVDEIASIRAKVVVFSDDNLFSDAIRAEKICDALIARKIKKRFIAQARIELYRYPRLLEKMVRAGFKALLLGIESPHDWILEQLNKGFDSATVRKAFKILLRYPMYYSGYFIYGNIGESKEEMLYIPRFAKEIGLDSIACNKLRIERFSPLRALAEATAGYHVTDRGELYSDAYSHATLKKIGRTIKFSFYTPARYLRILWKNVFVTHFFTFGEVLSLGPLLPRLIGAAIRQEIRRGRLLDSLKRTFFVNKP
ncbi:MAG: B12-binding domain-containing radical SAM protein [Candidatus Omnitrophica bacterium]|nr:B12-binding domain-containing radical SAM protein [Candidatus Omnitrophota bacterium]